ncbi:SRPBCC domain-containing protein [Stappia sp. GBMRC 2046]|uniref:SRPBCC domain-containing protein n=1 Tax=Stappia sediminis TaxID=2692190 RepID=A0A7X3LQZ6_9HYPH|nr:SRPBCC domain-containing protein [Stappia sediminis]MXN63471.1 SRPBCC domain-containing protein [Stappia sediminis]
MAADTIEARTLTLTRTLNTDPNSAFDAWINPQTLAKWWGPEGFTAPELKMDVREGGAWSTVMLSPEGSRHHVSGVYKAIDRPNRLVFTWAWMQDDGSRGHETEVEVAFAAKGNKTLMTLVQKVFKEAEHRDNHQKGWTSSFNKLERMFA